MTPAVLFILYAMSALAFLTVLAIIAVFLNKHAAIEREAEERRARDYLVARYYRDEPGEKEFSASLLADAYRRMLDQVDLPKRAAEKAYRDFSERGAIARWIRMLSSPAAIRRKVAASRLSLFPAAPTKFALVNRLRVEKRSHVKLYLIDALKGQMDQLTLEIIIQSVVGSKRFYQARAVQVIKNYILRSRCRIPDVFNSQVPELKELFVEVAEGVRRPDFEAALFIEKGDIERQIGGGCSDAYRTMTPPRLARMYRRILAAVAAHGADLSGDVYLHSDDPEIVRIAVDSLAGTATFAQIERLLLLADGRIPADVIAAAVRKIIDAEPILLPRIVGLVKSHPDPERRRVLARILANKIDYFVLRLLETAAEDLGVVVATLADFGLDASLIRFANLNRDAGVENALLPLIGAECERSPSFLAHVREYLDPGLLRKIGQKRAKVPAPDKEKGKPDPAKKRWLRAVLAVSILFFPLLFAAFSFRILFSSTPLFLAEQFVIFVNKASVVYYLAANLVYLILAVISIRGAAHQRLLWSIKRDGMLFEKGMLASISIIAPAYNEELSIVESVNSLLNLRYPDYEVVVVNDGSKDATLETLIDHFRLERRNVSADETLKTRPVRAVYANRSIPNLLVVDKANGGKADALNVGINFASREYVCGIDADSLLDPDALLKLMSTTIDHDEITLALGGNILPVNGCTVDHGMLEQVGLPKKWLPMAQTIEYLRSFTLGRIGWAELDALLIVSGAFGLFERRFLSEVGGYLTVATFQKDTVGEDMELVVRITRRAIERSLPFRVDFVHNANCYTEVPEKLKSLLKQRNRWQRGLINILSYHRRMIGNPSYGKVGLLAMPYYLFFETIGPLLEVQTYLALILGFAFGILALEIALLMFTVTIVLGMFLSMLSLFVTEKHTVFLPAKSTWKLIGLAIAENFGRRQFWSLYRVWGFLTSLKDDNSWGAMARVGFKK